MLAPLLISSLTACVLVMMAGWTRDQFVRNTDASATYPSFPMSPRRPGRAS
jgi:hypothetical protein